MLRCCFGPHQPIFHCQQACKERLLCVGDYFIFLPFFFSFPTPARALAQFVALLRCHLTQQTPCVGLGTLGTPQGEEWGSLCPASGCSSPGFMCDIPPGAPPPWALIRSSSLLEEGAGKGKPKFRFLQDALCMHQLAFSGCRGIPALFYLLFLRPGRAHSLLVIANA